MFTQGYSSPKYGGPMRILIAIPILLVIAWLITSFVGWEVILVAALIYICTSIYLASHTVAIIERIAQVIERLDNK